MVGRGWVSSLCHQRVCVLFTHVYVIHHFSPPPKKNQQHWSVFNLHSAQHMVAAPMPCQTACSPCCDTIMLHHPPVQMYSSWQAHCWRSDWQWYGGVVRGVGGGVFVWGVWGLVGGVGQQHLHSPPFTQSHSHTGMQRHHRSITTLSPYHSSTDRHTHHPHHCNTHTSHPPHAPPAHRGGHAERAVQVDTWSVTIRVIDGGCAAIGVGV